MKAVLSFIPYFLLHLVLVNTNFSTFIEPFPGVSTHMFTPLVVVKKLVCIKQRCMVHSKKNGLAQGKYINK